MPRVFSDADFADTATVTAPPPVARKSRVFSDADFADTPEPAAQPAINPVTERPVAEPSGLLRRSVGDTAIALGRGAIGLPEALTGIAEARAALSPLDVSAQLGGWSARQLRKVADFKTAKDVLDIGLTPETQEAQRRVSEAQGIFGKIGTMVQNPSTIVQGVSESLPSTFAGGAVGRGIMTLVPRLAPKAAAMVGSGVGEGLVSGGQTASSIQQMQADGRLTPRQAALAMGSGAVTMLISLVGNKLASKLNVNDIDLAIATGQGSREASKTLAERLRRLILGAALEGTVEELPQSVTEQMAQNEATGRPLMEGVADAAAQGLVSGVAMGAGANVSDRRRAQQPPPVPAQPPPLPPTSDVRNPAAGLTPEDARIQQLRREPTIQPPPASKPVPPPAPPPVVAPPPPPPPATNVRQPTQPGEVTDEQEASAAQDREQARIEAERTAAAERAAAEERARADAARAAAEADARKRAEVDRDVPGVPPVQEPPVRQVNPAGGKEGAGRGEVGAVAPPAATDPADALHRGLPVSVPKGATMIRVTDASGRQAVLPVDRAKEFADAGPYTKVEAGIRIPAKKGQNDFKPMDGAVTVKEPKPSLKPTPAPAPTPPAATAPPVAEPPKPVETAPAAETFSESAGPFTVEWGTRSRGNESESFDDYAEAVAFAKSKMKKQSVDFTSIRDDNGNERDESEIDPVAPKPAPAAAKETKPEAKAAEFMRQRLSEVAAIPEAQRTERQQSLLLAARRLREGRANDEDRARLSNELPDDIPGPDALDNEGYWANVSAMLLAKPADTPAAAAWMDTAKQLRSEQVAMLSSGREWTPSELKSYTKRLNDFMDSLSDADRDAALKYLATPSDTPAAAALKASTQAKAESKKKPPLKKVEAAPPAPAAVPAAPVVRKYTGPRYTRNQFSALSFNELRDLAKEITWPNSGKSVWDLAPDRKTRRGLMQELLTHRRMYMEAEGKKERKGPSSETLQKMRQAARARPERQNAERADHASKAFDELVEKRKSEGKLLQPGEVVIVAREGEIVPGEWVVVQPVFTNPSETFRENLQYEVMNEAGETRDAYESELVPVDRANAEFETAAELPQDEVVEPPVEEAKPDALTAPAANPLLEGTRSTRPPVRGETKAAQKDDPLAELKKSIREGDAERAQGKMDAIVGDGAKAAAMKADLQQRAKAESAASRFRPREKIIFEKPYVGPSGSSLVAYEWQWMPEEYVDKRGEDRVKRVSNWNDAELNEETGRMIVHQFVVKRPDGSTQIVSAETALQLLGYQTKAASESMPSLVSAVKTMARLQMERDQLTEQMEAEKKIADEAEALPLPKAVEDTIPLSVAENGPLAGQTRTMRVLRMGDAEVWLHDGPVNPERQQTLINSWRDKRRSELGSKKDWRILRDQIKDRERRIGQQEAKIKAINEATTQTPSPEPPAAPRYERIQPESKGQVKNEQIKRETDRIRQIQDARIASQRNAQRGDAVAETGNQARPYEGRRLVQTVRAIEGVFQKFGFRLIPVSGIGDAYGYTETEPRNVVIDFDRENHVVQTAHHELAHVMWTTGDARVQRVMDGFDEETGDFSDYMKEHKNKHPQDWNNINRSAARDSKTTEEFLNRITEFYVEEYLAEAVAGRESPSFRDQDALRELREYAQSEIPLDMAEKELAGDRTANQASQGQGGEQGVAQDVGGPASQRTYMRQERGAKIPVRVEESAGVSPALQGDERGSGSEESRRDVGGESAKSKNDAGNDQQDTGTAKGKQPAVTAAQDAAYLAAVEKGDTEAVQDGFTRLYRGHTGLRQGETRSIPEWLKSQPEWQGIKDATGRWFTPSLAEAREYAKDGNGTVSYVDVPTSELGKYDAANIPSARKFQGYGIKQGDEFLLPRDMAETSKEYVSAKSPDIRYSRTPPKPGVGAMNAEGPESFPGTSTVNAYNDEMRKRLGYDALPPAEQHKWSQAMDEAHAIYKDNPYAGDELVASLKAKPRPVSDTENMVLLRHLIQLQKIRNSAASDTHNSGTKEDKVRYAAVYAAAEARLDEAFYVNKAIAGREAGRALNVRKAFADDDFSLVNMRYRKSASNGGETLTPEQAKTVQDFYDEIDRLKKQFDAAKNPMDRARLLKALEGVKDKWKASLRRDRNEPQRLLDLANQYAKENGVELPQDVQDRLLAKLKAAQKITDETKRLEAFADAIQELVDHVPIRAGSWFDAYIYTNMLSSPMSHARNMLGNLTNTAGLRPLALIANKDFKGAEKFFTAAWGEAFNGNAWRAALESFRTGEMSKWMDTFDDPNMNPFLEAKRAKGPKNEAARRLWKSLTIVGRLMQAQDVYFGRMVEMGEAARLMDAGVHPEVAVARAKSLAAKYLYRDRLKNPDKSLDAVSQSLEHLGLTLDHLRRIPAIGPAMRMTIPFLKTPVKIAQFNAQVTPLGFIGANKNRIAQAHYEQSYDEMVQQAKQMEGATDPETILKREELQAKIEEVEWTSRERYGKAVVGLALTGIGMIAAATGDVIWEPPEDEKERKFFYDAGYRPYSFRVAGHWIPMMYLGPGMIAFAMPAALRRSMERNPNKPHEGSIERVAKVLTAIPEMMMDQLPVEGLATTMNYLTGKADYTLSRVAANYVKQVVPLSGLVRWVNRMVDPTFRKPTTIVESIEADIPGLSQYVKARQTSQGLPATADVMDAFTPYRIGKENTTMARKAKDFPLGKALHSATSPNADEAQKDEAIRLLKTMQPNEARRLLRLHVRGIKGKTEIENESGKDTPYGLRLMRLNQLISAARRSR